MTKDYAPGFPNAAKLFALATFLLAVVLLVPDAGQIQGQTFFTVAINTTWSRLYEWAAAWCSVKIILLSIAVLFAIDATGTLLVKRGDEPIRFVLFPSIVVPVLLLLFGIYELVKAVF